MADQTLGSRPEPSSSELADLMIAAQTGGATNDWRRLLKPKLLEMLGIESTTFTPDVTFGLFNIVLSDGIIFKIGNVYVMIMNVAKTSSSTGNAATLTLPDGYTIPSGSDIVWMLSRRSLSDNVIEYGGITRGSDTTIIIQEDAGITSNALDNSEVGLLIAWG